MLLLKGMILISVVLFIYVKYPPREYFPVEKALAQDNSHYQEPIFPCKNTKGTYDYNHPECCCSKVWYYFCIILKVLVWKLSYFLHMLSVHTLFILRLIYTVIACHLIVIFWMYSFRIILGKYLDIDCLHHTTCYHWLHQ